MSASRLQPVQALLQELAQAEIRLQVQGDELRIQAAKGRLTPALKAALQAHKNVLLAHLRADEDLPVSPIQQRLWFLQQLEPRSLRYHEVARLTLSGDLPSLERLSAAFEALQTAQGALRARFVQQPGRLQQRLLSPLESPPPLAQLPVMDSETLQDWLAAPFDLQQGPLYRGAWIVKSAQTAELVLVFHHLILDAWSAALILQGLSADLAGEDLAAADYRGYLLGLPLAELSSLATELPPDRLWQHPALSGLNLPRSDSALASALSGAVPDRGESLSLPLPAGLSERIQAQCRTLKVTRFVWLVSSWLAFVSRYWDQPALLLASPVTARQERDQQQLVGCLIDTLLLAQTTNPPTQSLAELVLAMQAQLQVELQTSADKRRDFAQRIQHLNPSRDLPFFPQLGFVIQDLLPDLPTLPNLKLGWDWPPFEAAKFELLLSWLSFRDEVQLTWPQGWYARSQMQQLLSDFMVFLEQGLLAPQQALATLPVRAAASTSALWLRWAPRHDFSQTEPYLHQGIEQTAWNTPERLALSWQDQTITYGELNQQAARWAAVLRRLGAGPGVSVALQSEVCPALIVGMLAVLKTGACYLPLDPLAPLARNQLILSDAQPLLWCGSSGCLKQGDQAELPLATRRLSWAELERLSQLSHLAELAEKANPAELETLSGLTAADFEQTWPAPEQVAYLIYTSGSTGQPNGVPITHGQVGRLFASVAADIPFEADEVWLLAHSPAFDYSVWEIWGAFSIAARLVLMPREWASQPERIWGLLAAEQITCLHQSPSSFRALLKFAPAQPFALKRLLFSAERLDLELLRPVWQNWGEQVAVYNLFGTTETTVFATVVKLEPSALPAPDQSVTPGQPLKRVQSPIGGPLADLGLILLNRDLEPVPDGVPAEICLWGPGLSAGYLERPELNARRWVELTPPAATGLGTLRLYRTGDRALALDGHLFYLDRQDRQLQVRGARVEPAEIELALQSLVPGSEAWVFADQSQQQTRLLAALVCPLENGPAELELKQRLRQLLPAVMIPDQLIALASWPLNANGKRDKTAVLAAFEQAPAARKVASGAGRVRGESQLYQQLHDLLCQQLQRSQIAPETSFFDLGAHSLLLVEIQQKIQTELGLQVELMQLFQYPNLKALVGYLSDQTLSDQTLLASTAASSSARETARPEPLTLSPLLRQETQEPIAIIGMALRLPGADSPEQFWHNLRTGQESITHWSVQDLLDAGEDPDLIGQPDYVPASGWCGDIATFDAAYFGISEREAQWLDPQQRLMLTLALEALERAGYGDSRSPLAAGVFASAGISRYLLESLLPRLQAADGAATLSPMQVLIANDKDYLATRVAYQLNLTGPAFAVQSACSSSLVAIHLACESLRRGEAELALAGGVNLDTRPRGYRHLEGGIYAQDGHCRPFDAAASGIVGGSGGAWVVLKPLAQARAAGDTIYAVIEGSACNNDGAQKAGFLAPGLVGQRDVVRQAWRRSGCRASDIGYLEAHGTGTRLGDPIEVEALRQAWQLDTPDYKLQSCALGSVKGNLGHLDAAAGVSSLIKVALMLYHRKHVPTINLDSPNPLLKLEASPFYLATTAAPWQGPLRAGISSLGVGGTNLHLICAAAPEPISEPVSEARLDAEPETNRAAEPAESAEFTQVLVLSAPSQQGLQQLRQALWQQLQTATESEPEFEPAPEPSLAQLAASLGRRRPQRYRQALVVADLEQVTQQLSVPLSATTSLSDASDSAAARGVVFLCPGLGSQRPGQWGPLYTHSAHFRAALDHLAACMQTLWPHDIKALMLDPELASLDLSSDPERMQPLIFAGGWCLAQFWQGLGLRPQALIGHSFGECLAACLGGICDLEQALQLVIARGRAFAQAPAGAVLALAASADSIFAEGLWPAGVELATHNADQRLSLSVPQAQLAETEQLLRANKRRWRALPIGHLVHHSHLEPCLQDWSAALTDLRFQAPELPVWSCLQQDWHQAAPLPGYWAEQALAPLDFRGAPAALSSLMQDQQRSPAQRPGWLIELDLESALSALFHHTGIGICRTAAGPAKQVWSRLLQQVAQLWQTGQELSLQTILPTAAHWPLPPTPLDPRRYWLDAISTDDSGKSGPLQRSGSWSLSRLPQSQWLQFPSWQRLPQTRSLSGAFVLSPGELLDLLATEASQPDGFPELILLQAPVLTDLAQTLDYLESCRRFIKLLQQAQWSGCLSWICPAFSAVIHQQEALQPLGALLLGLSRSLPPELAWSSALIEMDVDLDPPLLAHLAGQIQALWQQGEGLQPASWHLAWRQGRCWQLAWQALGWPAEAPAFEQTSTVGFRVGGVYLITGASGGLAQAFAAYLQQHYQARLIFSSRQPESVWRSAEKTVFAKDVPGLYVQGDLTQLADCRALVAAGLARFGSIEGVIHTAGSAQDFGVCETDLPLAPALAAKVAGLLHLSQALQEAAVKLEIGVLCASLSSQVSSPGQMAYTAGNAFLDSWAQAHRPWRSLNWGHWRERGMAQRLLAHLPAAYRPAYQAYLELGLGDHEGCQALEAALLTEEVQVAISPLAIGALQTALDQQTALLNPVLGATEPILAQTLAEQKQAILGLWQQVLGQVPQPEQRFSDLGGDSLAALQLKAALESQLGLKVPVTLLLADLPCAEFIAAVLPANDSAADFASDSEALSTAQAQAEPMLTPAALVPLNRQQSTASPLYFVHAISGTVFPFQGLAQCLSRPLVGLQSRGLAEPTRGPHQQIPAMASAYCRLIESRQAAPYLIGGWSFGALVAYEMARQWLARGIAVEGLILLDMQAPDQMAERGLDAEALRSRFHADLAALQRGGGLQSPLADPLIAQLKQIFEAHVQASQAYLPPAQPLELEALLLRAEASWTPEQVQRDLGWRPFLKHLQVQQIPGDHYSCLQQPALTQWSHYLE